MANPHPQPHPENLARGHATRFSGQAADKAAESGRKGGRKSQAVQREKRTVLEMLENMLARQVTDKKTGERMSLADMYIANVISASAKRGDSRLLEMWCRLRGEFVEKREISGEIAVAKAPVIDFGDEPEAKDE